MTKYKKVNGQERGGEPQEESDGFDYLPPGIREQKRKESNEMFGTLFKNLFPASPDHGRKAQIINLDKERAKRKSSRVRDRTSTFTG